VSDTEASIEPFADAHLDGVIALVGAEGWAEYADDPDQTRRALIAPGATTLVALADGQVVGAICGVRLDIRTRRPELRELPP
jgi:hypothetical protein